MHVERLTKLAELMDAVQADKTKRENFDIGQWVHNCGSPACAAGWAMSDPWFQSQGLKKFTKLGIPTFDGLAHTEALEAFFDLTEDQSNLFHQDGYDADGEGYITVEPADVANKIRELLDSTSTKKDA
jgi:hypothetical protein